MPFGLTSAPNTWARLVTHVMQEIPKSQLIVFVDDLLIHSPDLTPGPRSILPWVYHQSDSRIVRSILA